MRNSSKREMELISLTFFLQVVTTNLRIIDDNIRALEITEKCSKDASDCQQSILSILKQNFQQINSGFKEMKESRSKKQKEKVCIISLPLV